MPIAPYHVHPMLVHFPIALFSVAAFFEGVMPLLRKEQKERWQWVGSCLLWTGTMFSAFTIASGLWAEATVPAIPSAYDSVILHKYGGIAVGIIALVLSLWRFFRRPPQCPRPRLFYLLLWLGLLGLLVFTGFYGGRLVYDFAVGVENFTRLV